MRRRRVTAENITARTARAAGVKGPYPAPEDLLDTLRARLATRAADFAARRAAAAPGALGDAFNIAAARAEGRPAKLEKLVRDMPQGTALCAVFYKPVPAEQRRAVEAEFIRSVMPRFLKYIARHHKGWLKKELGHDDHDITCLSFGLLPKTREGRIRAFGVDHRMQRGGGGNLCEKSARAKDPRQKDADEKFAINDFSNLEYISDARHEYKNEWLAVQEAWKLPPEGGWIVYPVTKRDAAPPFFAPAQKEGHPLAGVGLKPEKMEQEVSLASLRVKQTLRHVHYLQRHPSAWTMIRAFRALAESRNTTVTALAAEGGKTELRPLPEIFRDFAAWSPGMRNLAGRRIAPALAEAGNAVAKVAFTSVLLDLRVSRNRTAFSAFTTFYNGRYMTSLRKTAANLPLAEAGDFCALMDGIDKKLSEIRMEDYLSRRAAPLKPAAGP